LLRRTAGILLRRTAVRLYQNPVTKFDDAFMRIFNSIFHKVGKDSKDFLTVCFDDGFFCRQCNIGR